MIAWARDIIAHRQFRQREEKWYAAVLWQDTVEGALQWNGLLGCSDFYAYRGEGENEIRLYYKGRRHLQLGELVRYGKNTQYSCTNVRLRGQGAARLRAYLKQAAHESNERFRQSGKLMKQQHEAKVRHERQSPRPLLK